MRRRYWLALFLVMAFGCLIFRMCYWSHYYVQLGKNAEHSSNLQTAELNYRRAMAFYLPLNPFNREALDGLRRIAEIAKSRGDTNLELSTWRDIRYCLFTIRSFYQPYGDVLKESNQRLLDLDPSHQPPPLFYQPKTAWVLATLAGFIVWVILTGRVLISERREWLVCVGSGVGFGLFLLGLWKA